MLTRARLEWWQRIARQPTDLDKEVLRRLLFWHSISLQLRPRYSVLWHDPLLLGDLIKAAPEIAPFLIQDVHPHQLPPYSYHKCLILLTHRRPTSLGDT